MPRRKESDIEKVCKDSPFTDKRFTKQGLLKGSAEKEKRKLNKWMGTHRA